MLSSVILLQNISEIQSVFKKFTENVHCERMMHGFQNLLFQNKNVSFNSVFHV